MILRAILFIALLVSTTVQAGLKCEVDLKFGVLVNEKHIRITDDGRTVYQINGLDQLIVDGNWVQLDSEQAHQLQLLSKGLHYVVPKMIVLATEGVQLAVETVENVYIGLVGAEHKSLDKLKSSLKRANKRVREKFIRAGNNFYMGPGSLENVDELVDRELEEQLEAAITTSVGGVLSAIGGLAAGEGETEQKMQDLSQRLEEMGEQIEREVAPKADNLRNKAHWFCNKMRKLDRVEEALRSSVPELKKYNVIYSQAEQML